MWKIHPATEQDIETVADDLAAVIWEIRRRLASTPHMWLVPEICAEFDIQIGEVA